MILLREALHNAPPESDRLLSGQADAYMLSKRSSVKLARDETQGSTWGRPNQLCGRQETRQNGRLLRGGFTGSECYGRGHSGCSVKAQSSPQYASKQRERGREGELERERTYCNSLVMTRSIAIHLIQSYASPISSPWRFFLKKEMSFRALKSLMLVPSPGDFYNVPLPATGDMTEINRQDGQYV